ncbi:HD domain-containing protein [Mesobacillus zeae]|uniref:HD domain-containing protein n=1 Tax=Mesobacillus zeae TaxID=1917180 RepID=A0A398BBB1_9BACI|nr:HD domain-containing protein [Mesobacillus zeae]RID86731.1 HD domain-containing protein [Mesobacillus zeae]
MKLVDKMYGEFILEPVLEELINSAAVQRLKKIHQGGASYLVNEQWNGTRYEHSVGVMLLIRQLGGSIEEQIAGLLHDVSHTAFSHVIDYVFDEKNEDYHEKIFTEVIEGSDISTILVRYGLEEKNIMEDLSQWSILEQPLPELCADRIDYTLRDMLHFGVISLEEIETFLSHLVMIEGKICIDDIGQAEWFVDTYYKEVIDYFLDPLNIYGYTILSQALKIALRKNILKPNYFLRTDEEVMDLLYRSNDEEVIRLLRKLQEDVILMEDEEEFDYHMKQKERLIDPPVWMGNKLVMASSISGKVARQTKRASVKAQKGVHLRVVRKHNQ